MTVGIGWSVQKSKLIFALCNRLLPKSSDSNHALFYFLVAMKMKELPFSLSNLGCTSENTHSSSVIATAVLGKIPSLDNSLYFAFFHSSDWLSESCDLEF